MAASMCKIHRQIFRQLTHIQTYNVASAASGGKVWLPHSQHGNPILDRHPHQIRTYSNESGKRSFIGQFIDNLKSEMSKNKEMKENIKKFREEAEKLEQSDALKAAREKYDELETETSKSGEMLRKTYSEIKDKVGQSVEEMQKQEWVKKGIDTADGISKTAKGAAQRVTKSGEDLVKSKTFQSISEGVKAVKHELDESTTAKARAYKAPVKLRKRTEHMVNKSQSDKQIEINEDDTGMVLHKDSKFYEQWKNFTENNQVFTKILDWKVKYDESENMMVRATRSVTDRVSNLLGKFTPTETSEVLTEIIKIDPSFSKEKFLNMCEEEIIPNVLEAMIRGDLEILKDWCYEAPYSQLATPIQQAKAMGYKFDSRILDVDSLDIAMGKMMEQGPVLVITFQAQQIMVVKNMKDEIIEGDPEKVMRVTYVWVLCRDQEVLDPSAAWKVLDLSANSAQQWV
ncbi:mitochondrial import inner membrane translocase subunit TIM44-like [Anneissia japonica]|uniref:mitochondrial import inner membrane translocase subunit TIM44-like n=1 Tax=Anneissia japonica TaxID=1529436 RepID=UPI0014257F01|nr:mitochondrial import inner membrane translocase subunit TIM44-like [Anneissia japonica]